MAAPMRSKFRGPRGKRGGFGRQEQVEPGVSKALISQARKSGMLNLSGRSLTSVPDSVWRVNIDAPEEARDAEWSTQDGNSRWWDQVELTKLILASNQLRELSPSVTQLHALSVLDLHDNHLVSLPDNIGELGTLTKLNVSHNQLVSLPNSIQSLTQLTSLQAAHNQITLLSDGVGSLFSVEEMDFSYNVISSLPTSMSALTKLLYLNMSNNALTFIPDQIGMITNLRRLDLTHNKLTEIPEEVAYLRKLEQLYLRHNKLTALPRLYQCKSLKELHAGNNCITMLSAEDCKCLTTVNVLDLRDNKITTIPEEISVITQLQRLDITNNNITMLPFVLGTLIELKSLVVDGNPMRGIRRDIIQRGTEGIKKYLCSRIDDSTTTDNTSPLSEGPVITPSGSYAVGPKYVSFKTLDYSVKSATDIPEEVWQEGVDNDVTFVNIEKNRLSEIPVNIGLLAKQVKQINASFNKITTAPASLCMFTVLTHIDMRNNGLTDLPKEWEFMKSLQEINVNCNRLLDIPAVLYTIQTLENILCSDNQITTVYPDRLINLPKLSTLDLRNNNISQVPMELGNLSTLRSLQLEGNPFRNPRPALLSKGTAFLLDYMKSRIVSE